MYDLNTEWGELGWAGGCKMDVGRWVGGSTLGSGQFKKLASQYLIPKLQKTMLKNSEF
jgi:hypothetical protein